MATTLKDRADEAQKQPRRGIYLLPNLLTTLGLFAAFYAIVSAMDGRIDNAIIAIYVAMIADALDGRIARLTNTQSAFGAQYDSLSDMLCFGAAPGLIVYQVTLFHLGKIGWLICFFYTVATALRLARFNIQVSQDKRYFAGMPCPSASSLVISTLWVSHYLGVSNAMIVYIIIAIVMVLTAILMTSSVRYFSFKDLDLTGKVPFFVILITVLVVVAIAWNPPWVLFLISMLYTLSGPLLVLFRKKKRHKKLKRLEKKITSHQSKADE
ncbi:MAG: CDP-diacylglycerol--serine O-phosphatidyltransferase [Pseudomonadota bacterium]